MRTDHIKPRTMRCFVMLADGQTMTQVALSIGASQPSVSISVQRAEDLLGYQVLRRSESKHKILGTTERGRAIVEQFRRVIAVLDGEVLEAA